MKGIVNLKIENQRMVYRLMVASFEIQYRLSINAGYIGPKSYLHLLCIQARDEIEKEHPDLDLISTLHTQIESCITENIDKNDQ